MFNKIKRTAGPRAQHMTLRVVEHRAINAYVVSSGQVTLFTGMLKFNDGYPHATAGVIGHEIAHHILGHTTHNHLMCRITDAGSRKCESDSDVLGMELIKRAGYDQCKAAKIWLRMYYRWGNVGGTSHPKVLDRYENTRCK